METGTTMELGATAKPGATVERTHPPRTGALAAERGAESGAGGARAGRRAHIGLTWVDHATLIAIGLVVLIVSLPRLRAFALRENERDALRMLRVLSTDAIRHGDVLGTGGLGALLAASSAHRVRLEDLEVLDHGRLRRHGYLFDAVEAPRGSWILRAWPWDHGHTGLGAFQITPGSELYGTRNERGAFSGPAAPPPPARVAGSTGDDGWVVLPER